MAMDGASIAQQLEQERDAMMQEEQVILVISVFVFSQKTKHDINWLGSVCFEEMTANNMIVFLPPGATTTKI